MNIDLGVLGPVVMIDCKYYWKKYEYTVLYDGFTKDGIRVHIVAEELPLGAKILDNAIVISISEV